MNSTMQRSTTGLLLAVVLAAAGCGSSSKNTGSTGDEQPTEQEVITMITQQEYQMYPGDEVQPDEQAGIRVRHELSTDTKFATLVSGNAQILRETTTKE